VKGEDLILWTREELKSRAKAVLKVSYWKAFLVGIVLAIVGGNIGTPNMSINQIFDEESIDSVIESASDFFILFSFIGMAIFFTILGFAFRIFLGAPLEVGASKYFINSTQYDFDLNLLGYSFSKSRYWDIVVTMLWRGFMLFLWFLLLIIPGIIKSYAYRMVPYILADNPNIGYKRALEVSSRMTDGEKFRIFVLDLSFLGWYILGMLAFGIGVIFVWPYQYATNAELYIELREHALYVGHCSYEELLLENPQV